jgi:hypothetical protein
MTDGWRAIIMMRSAGATSAALLAAALAFSLQALSWVPAAALLTDPATFSCGIVVVTAGQTIIRPVPAMLAEG